MDGWRNMTLLMVLTGDEAVEEAMESRLLLARDEDEYDRRNEVRRVVGEKREAMAWNLEDCIVMFGRGGSVGDWNKDDGPNVDVRVDGSWSVEFESELSDETTGSREGRGQRVGLDWTTGGKGQGRSLYE